MQFWFIGRDLNITIDANIGSLTGGNVQSRSHTKRVGHDTLVQLLASKHLAAIDIFVECWNSSGGQLTSESVITWRDAQGNRSHMDYLFAPDSFWIDMS